MEKLPSPDDIPLTEQQRRFVAEFVADPKSATRAYQRAFNLPYTHESSRTQACQLLKNPHIQAALAAQRREWGKGHRVTFRRLITKLASIAFGDVADLYESDPDNGGLPKPRPWDHIPPTARKNIKSIKFKRRKLKSESSELYELEEFDYKVADQEWALGKLCEYLGVTKGSLTADELRAIIYGNAANAAATPQDQAALPAASTEAGADTPVIKLHPDE